jgi:predicted kinase
MGALFVVVNGPPGSGKTTLAGALAVRLGLPVIAKDTIKEALMSVLDVPDIESSRRLGRASMAALLGTVGAAGTSVVLDANFRRSLAAGELRQLPGQVVEVFCLCPREQCIARYRAREGRRARGHFDAERDEEDIWNDEVAQPVDGGWPVVRVDTGRPVQLDEVIGLIEHALGAAAPRHRVGRYSETRPRPGI